MNFTAVIPARNEESGIARCIGSIVSAAQRASAVAEVLVVDDGSSDGTASRAEASGARVLRHETRLGALAAWATGVNASQSPVVVFVDADCVIDEEALVLLLEAVERPGVGVASGRAVPVEENYHGNRSWGGGAVRGSARFSAALLDELKARLGDHDFVPLGRLMAVRREAWHIGNTQLPHCDRQVASAARRAGWQAVWVPQAIVYYDVPASFRELQSDWRRTRLALARSPQRFDVIPRAVQVAAALAAFRAAPLDGLYWMGCRARLMWGVSGRRDRAWTREPVGWD